LTLILRFAAKFQNFRREIINDDAADFYGLAETKVGANLALFAADSAA
jgi:hypothetical protein